MKSEKWVEIKSEEELPKEDGLYLTAIEDNEGLHREQSITMEIEDLCRTIRTDHSPGVNQNHTKGTQNERENSKAASRDKDVFCERKLLLRPRGSSA